MEAGVYIFLDEDFERPVFARPDPEEADEALWAGLCEAVHDAYEGEGDRAGTGDVDGYVFAWVLRPKFGLAFVATAPDRVDDDELSTYLADLVERYFDEVDDVRRPDPDGVEDVIIDVVAPWEDDEED